MIDVVAQLVLSNLLVSAALALAAYAVHRRGRLPVLAHLLWVLVLLKLVTPPLLTVPIASLGGPASAMVAAPGAATSELSLLERAGALAAEHGIAILVLIWMVGALAVLAVSSWRIARFDRLVRRTSTEAPLPIQGLAMGLVGPLGLRTAPKIFLSRSRLSPLTWWAGRRVRIVIPADLPGQIGPERLRWVIAHELAHVRRRDYLVRWLEWIACVAFWWNPIVWWTRRNLHEAEEAACDALVVDRLGLRPRSYAGALLTVVEFLSGVTRRPPAVATGIDADGSLERRLLQIMATGRMRQAPRWLVVAMLAASVTLMPLGVGSTSVDPGPTSLPAAELPLFAPADAGAAPQAAEVETFAFLSSDRPGATRGAAARTSGAVAGSSIRQGVRVTTRARRAVKRAARAALVAGSEGPGPARRAARKAIANARLRLGRAVAREVISADTAQSLVADLRSLMRPRPGASGDSAAHVDEAIAAGVVTRRTAAILGV